MEAEYDWYHKIRCTAQKGAGLYREDLQALRREAGAYFDGSAEGRNHRPGTAVQRNNSAQKEGKEESKEEDPIGFFIDKYS